MHYKRARPDAEARSKSCRRHRSLQPQGNRITEYSQYGIVGSVVVHNDMHLESSGHLRLVQIEELAKFQRTMAGLELRHHLAGL